MDDFGPLIFHEVNLTADLNRRSFLTFCLRWMHATWKFYPVIHIDVHDLLILTFFSPSAAVSQSITFQVVFRDCHTLRQQEQAEAGIKNLSHLSQHLGHDTNSLDSTFKSDL